MKFSVTILGSTIVRNTTEVLLKHLASTTGIKEEACTISRLVNYLFLDVDCLFLIQYETENAYHTISRSVL